MLSLRPMSGYEIRQAIAQSIGNFWSESYGQIYPTLKRLVAEGLVEETAGGRKARQGRAQTVYRLTAGGRRRLRAWLKTPSAEQVPRNEMLLKIFFARQGRPGIVRQQVEAYRRRHEELLERYAGIQRWMEEARAGHPDRPYWEMTLAYGCAESEAYLRWSEAMLRRVQDLEGLEGSKEERDAR